MDGLLRESWDRFKFAFDTWREFVPMVGDVPCSVMPTNGVTRRIADIPGLFSLEGVSHSLHHALMKAGGFSDGRLENAIASLALQWDHYFHAACEPLRDRWLQTELGADTHAQIIERAQRFIEGAYGEPLVFLLLGSFAEASGLYPEDIRVGQRTLASFIEEEHERFNDFASVYHDAHIIFDTDGPESSRMSARRRGEKAAGTFYVFEDLRHERDEILIRTFGEPALRNPEQLSYSITIPVALEQARSEEQRRSA